MSGAGPILETERLILRPPIANDFGGWCAFHADGEAMIYLSGVQSHPVVWRTMRSSVGGWILDGFHFFSAIKKFTGDWVGRIGPIYPLGWPGTEVGWGLLSKYWGRSYARVAATRAINFAFDKLGWVRVIHLIHPDNVRSQAVAKALGSHRDGPGKMPDPFAHIPVDIWSQSKQEWRERIRDPAASRPAT